MDPVANLRATAATMQQLLAGLGQDQLRLPTPCAEWDVADLADHVIANLLNSFAHWAGTDVTHQPCPIAAELAGRYAAAVDVVLETYEVPGVLDKRLDTPIGEFPGAAVLGVCFADQLTHVWDLSRAIGCEVEVPDQLAEDALAVWAGFIRAPLRNGSLFGDASDPGPGLPALDRLAAFTGRTL
jgi:uncharacterized protein (TIGR03086 family)